MTLPKYAQIQTPTLLIDKTKALKNLNTMAAKAAAQNIRFRPHFKTHQSAQIGEWFREAGVQAITTSSLTMAAYFADHGWQDILVAFPVNLREMTTIQNLAARIKLGLLVESEQVIDELGKNIHTSVDIWIKVDTGLHRTGLDWQNTDAVFALVQAIQRYPDLNLCGLLTHAGQTYHAHSKDEIQVMYAESWQAIHNLRQALQIKGVERLELSVGDTPGCWLSDDLGQVDEIRPGNFIYFDAMMQDLGVCLMDEIAVAVACPVVALHPERNEVVIYGGAIHLSKEALVQNGSTFYGYAAFPSQDGWQLTSLENRVLRISQEHGVVHLTDEDITHIQVGDLLCILPVHSCLVVDAMRTYRTLQGENIETYLSCKKID